MSSVLEKLRRSPRRYAHFALACSQALCLFAFARSWSLIDGFPLDDAWIHQAVARTLATTGTLGYAPGHHGAGATSYLWAVLLATNFRFFHVDPPAFTLALNASLSLASGQLLLALLLRGRSEDRTEHVACAFVASVLACEGGNFLWFAYSGMEGNLVILLVLLAIHLYVPAPGVRPSSAGAWGAGLAAGALALTRPEAASLGLMLAVLSTRVGRTWRDALRVIVGWGLALGIYVGSNLIATGVAAPATLEGRRWLWLDGFTALSRPAIAWEFVSDWLLRLRNATLGTSATALLWVCLGLAVYGAHRWVRARNASMILVLGWTLVHVGTYLVLMPVAGHGGRYQPLVPLIFLAAVGSGSAALLESLADLVFRDGKRAWVSFGVAVASVAPWVALVGVGVRDWGGDHAKAVIHIRATECAMGDAINELPDGAAVASFDIGCSGFVSKRPVLDIGGLSDPRTVGLMKEGRVWEYLRAHDVQYVALPLAYQDTTTDPVNFGARLRLFDNPAVRLDPVRYFVTPYDIWAPGVAATQHAAPRQGLFHVTYTGKPGPRGGPTVRAPALPVDDPGRLLAWRQRAMLDDTLQIMAGAGVPVHLSFTAGRPAEVTRSATGWEVALGPCGVTVAPSTGDKVPPDAALALVARSAQPYLERWDFFGAGLIALHAIARAERRWGDPLFYPALPGVPSSSGIDANSPQGTFMWGFPVALLVLLASLAAATPARTAELARAIGGLVAARMPRRGPRASAPVDVHDSLTSQTERG